MDNVIRRQAEEKLLIFRQQPGYALTLAHISLNSQLPVGYRHRASIEMKNYIKSHWFHDENFQPPEITPKEKALIRDILPRGLSEPHSGLRTALAMSLALVAVWDWPNEWPGFIEQLAKCLESDNTVLVSGAIKCMSIFATDDYMTDQHLPVLVPVALPILHRILSNEKAYDVKIRTQAVRIIQSCVQWLGKIQGADGNQSRLLMKKTIPQWLPIFVHILEQPLLADASNCGVKINVIQTLGAMVAFFPKQIKEFLAPITSIVWKTLLQLYPIYKKNVIDEDLLDECGQDSDGNVESFEMLVVVLFSYIGAVAESRKFRLVLQSILPELMAMIISYMQITADQEQLWEDDPNQFIADEDNFLVVVTVRPLCKELIEKLTRFFKLDGIKAFLAALTNRLRQPDQTWRSLEAVAFAIGLNAEHFAKAGDAFNVAEVFNKVLSVGVESSESKLLNGTCLRTAGLLASQVPAEVSYPFLMLTCRVLVNSAEHISTRLAAASALSEFCDNLTPELKQAFAKTVPEVVQPLCELSLVAGEDALHLLLGAIYTLIECNGDAVTPKVAVLDECLVRVWKKHFNSEHITNDVQFIVRLLSNVPACALHLQRTFLPVLLPLLVYDANQISGIVQAALYMVADLVGAMKELNAEVASKVFSLVVQQMVASDDSEIIEAGAGVLKSFVQVGGDSLAEISDEQGRSLLAVATDICLKLLGSSYGEATIGPSGKLTLALLTKCPKNVQGELGNRLLQSVVLRFCTANTQTLQQNLLFVLTRLINLNTDGAIRLLWDMQLNGERALPAVLNNWTSLHADLVGKYDTHLSLVALGKLLALKNAELGSVPVRGALQVDVNSARARRSARQKLEYSTMPFYAKVLELMLSEHMLAAEDDSDGEGGWDDEYSSGEDDDEEEEGAGAGYFEGADEDPFAAASLFQGLLNGTIALAMDEDDTNDPDILNDPVYHLDMQEYVENFLGKLFAEDREGVARLAIALPDQQKLHFHKLFLSGGGSSGGAAAAASGSTVPAAASVQ